MKRKLTRSLAALMSVLMLFTCFTFSASAEDAASYQVLRATCTVNGDTATRRGFAWFTATDCDSVLQVVPAKEFEESFSKAVTFAGTSKLFEGYYSHKAVAEGLTPGTLYYYRVGSLEQNTWGGIGKFYTDDGDGKFSFLAIADVQASSLENFAKASLTMKGAMKTDPKAEFVVNLGDFVNDCTNEEWNWYGETFEEANTNLTLAPVAGNHEGNITNKLNVGWFDTTFNLLPAEGSPTVNGVYYSYDYGNAHFCVINTNDMYPMTEMQRNWIVNDLNASDAMWKIVMMHRSAYSAGKNIDKPDTVAMRATIIELMDKTGADLVLSGHDHMYMRTTQCYADAVCEDVKYVTEKVAGEEITYALNPKGTVYALPSTAGTKRYAVNENAIDPIMDCADVYMSTRDKGGCFANIEISNGDLVYKAYLVDDATQEISCIDTYAIRKTAPREPDDGKTLPTDVIGTIDNTVLNFISEIFGLLTTYLFKLLPQVVKGAIGK